MENTPTSVAPLKKPLKAEKIPVMKLIEMQVLVEAGETDGVIAEKLQLSIDDVSEIIIQENWRAILSDTEQSKRADVRVRERWKRAIAVNSRFLSMKGFKMANDAAERNDTIGFANAARGTKTFVDLARQADGMDEGESSEGSVSINLFCFTGEARPTAEHAAKLERMKRAEQATDEDAPGGGGGVADLGAALSRDSPANKSVTG